MTKNKLEQFSCPAGLTLGLLSGKYKMVLLWYLRQARRYGELQRLLEGVTPKMLIQQLRELESDGLVWRKVYPSVPPKVEYGLTACGESLLPLLEGMRDWGAAYQRSLCLGKSQPEPEES